MQQKNIWTCYLIVGLFLSSILGSCNSEGEYPSKSVFRFVNNTAYALDYSIIQIYKTPKDTIRLFSLPPLTDTTFVTEGTVLKNSDSEEQGIIALDNALQQKGFPVHLRFGETKCKVFQDGEGSTTSNIKAYDIEKLEGNRHYRYTYIITNAHYETAEDCN